MARGIKDKVAILGMGCSRFGERWNADNAEDLDGRGLQGGASPTRASKRSQIEMAWLSHRD